MKTALQELKDWINFKYPNFNHADIDAEIDRLIKKESDGNKLEQAKYSVSLFFRMIDESTTTKTTKERLICKIVSANNEDEAFGIAYRMSKDDFAQFDLVYSLPILIY